MKRIVIWEEAYDWGDGHVSPAGYVPEGGASLAANMEDAKVFFADSKRTKERYLKYTKRYKAIPVKIVLDK